MFLHLFLWFTILCDCHWFASFLVLFFSFKKFCYVFGFFVRLLFFFFFVLYVPFRLMSTRRLAQVTFDRKPERTLRERRRKQRRPSLVTKEINLNHPWKITKHPFNKGTMRSKLNHDKRTSYLYDVCCP